MLLYFYPLTRPTWQFSTYIPCLVRSGYYSKHTFVLPFSEETICNIKQQILVQGQDLG